MPDQVGLLIASARRRLKQAVMARSGLAPQQFWTLVALSERPGLSLAELAEQLRADPPTLSRVVRGLSRRRLVRSAADPRDRRRLRLRLTAAGERLGQELGQQAVELRSAVVAGLDAPALEALRGGLRHVIANLDRLAAPARRRTRG